METKKRISSYGDMKKRYPVQQVNDSKPVTMKEVRAAVKQLNPDKNSMDDNRG